MNPAFNKKRKSFAFTLGLLASAFLVPAVLATELYAEENGQKTVTLTVDSAVDYAKKNSRTLKSADIDLDIKRRASAHSWNVLFPDVTGISRGMNTKFLQLRGIAKQRNRWWYIKLCMEITAYGL